MNRPDPLGSIGEVLTQSEVERLLHQVKSQEFSTTVIKSSGQRESRKPEEIQPYDFRQPAFLAASELRKIRLRHEDFIRSLAANLSVYLRLEFTLRMSKLQTVVYQKFIESLSNPTHVVLFKTEPLKGICLLDMAPHLGLTLVDRLLGGPAHSVSANRDLSEIETALLDQAVQIILSEWCNQWQKLLDLRPVILSHETHARFLHTAPHDTVMLALAMEASLGDCVEDIQLAFPYYTIEPLVRQVAQSAGPDKEPVAPANGNPRWNRQFNDVPVRVTAGWDGLILSTRELASLKPGDVLTIEPQCFNQIQLRLAGLSRFAGRLGTRDQKWAVEVGQVLKS